MGLRTIAEAVEDEPALDVLRELGVDYVQGYQSTGRSRWPTSRRGSPPRPAERAG